MPKARKQNNKTTQKINPESSTYQAYEVEEGIRTSIKEMYKVHMDGPDFA
jgi:SMC interacting uncharacterized protein involved in chromosome segregation